MDIFDHRELSHGLTVLMAFFAIMNPIANTPLFLALTGGADPRMRRRVALQGVLAAFVIVVLFCLLGQIIFDAFGITIAAFRIAGGALIVLIGYQMLHGGPSQVQHPSSEDRAQAADAALSVALTPLAIPILAGPGTIATAMSYASGGLTGLVITIGAFALLCIVTYLFFVSGERLVRFLGSNGLNVVTRIMGLILAVIGVQMVVDGIHGAFDLPVPQRPGV